MEGLRLNRSKFAAVTLPSGSVLVIGGKKNEGKPRVSETRAVIGPT